MASPPLLGTFNTPANERSFSALVDQVVLETGRVASLRSIVGYVNLSIKECQALGLFARDMREIEVAATAQPFVWERPRQFRSIKAVKYETSCDYPKLRVPGKIQAGYNSYFYAVDDSYVFKGMAMGEMIALAVYFWANPFIYYARKGVVSTGLVGGPYTTRKAYYDIDQLKWQYLALDGLSYVDTIGDAAEELLRRTTTSMWIVDDWWDLLVEGAKAKVHKQFGDERSALAFANYKQQQKILAFTSGTEAEAGALVGNE